MGRRIRELEQALSQKETEIAQLRARVDELGAVVERYRGQESAIAGALTKAQTASERIVREAQEEKDAILRRADEQKREAEQEAAGIVADAQRRASIIEEQARRRAHETAQRAEAFMVEYRESANKLIDAFRRTAAEASEQAQQFASAIGALNLDEAIEATHEYDHVAALTQTPAQDMPDDYVDPASLMRSIYQIEQRELPEDAVEEEAAAEVEPEAVPGEPALDPFSSWARPEEKPEASEESAWNKDALDLEKKEEDGHVWTIEEIVERTNADAGAQIDDELNAIIEDVLRGS